MVTVNTADQMEKRFTGQFPGIELVVSSVEGSSAHIPAALRNGACRSADPSSAWVPSGGVVATIDRRHSDLDKRRRSGGNPTVRYAHFPKKS